MRKALVVCSLALVACSGGEEAPRRSRSVRGRRIRSAQSKSFKACLLRGDFAAASSLAIPGQAGLASLAEGATPSAVAATLEDGDGEVAANFWNGFAQGVGETFVGEVVVEDLGTTSEEGVEFFVVGVTPEGRAPSG